MNTLTRLFPTTTGVIRRLASSTLIRVGALVLAALVTLVVLIHVVEYWRGKRAWDRCRRDLEARGETLDWAAFTPPLVPDSQNIFKAPMMRNWFVGRGANEFTKHVPTLSLDAYVRSRYSNSIPAIAARVTIVRPGETIPAGAADIVLRYEDGYLTSPDQPPSGSNAVGAVSGAVLPQIVIDGARLDDAVNNLARQAGLNVIFDRDDIGFLKALPNGSQPPMLSVTVRWTNISARQALARLLDMHGLRTLEDPKTGVTRVVMRDRGDRSIAADSTTRGRLEKLAVETIGPVANAAEGYTITARSLDRIHAARVYVESEKALSPGQVEGLFPVVSTVPVPGVSADFAAESTGTNSYRLVLSALPAPAADYLAWSDEVEGDYDILREALKRPYARMGGRYDLAMNIRIPNFVALRLTAQRQSTRARCHLMLGQPEAAMRELTLVHDLNRIMEARPNGKPMTLVAAMIEVAITGLYCNVVADGLRWTAWRDSDLATIQKQLGEIDLPPMVRSALAQERAGVCHLAETTPPAELGKLLDFSNTRTTKTREVLMQLVPRGWVYQNMTVVARLDQPMMESIDLKNDLILPARATSAYMDLDSAFKHWSPYTYLAAIAIPNFVRAVSTMGRNQTMAAQALIACGLERYRRVHGEYPADLAALVPQFVDKLPHDIVDGGALKYRRLKDGQFLLYGVGWNGTDDGGVTATKNDNGDWVWDAP